MMNQHLFAQLLSRKLSGEATPEELEQLQELLKQQPADDYFAGMMEEYWRLHQSPEMPLEAGADAHFNYIISQAKAENEAEQPAAAPPAKRLKMWKLAAAAAAIFIMVLGIVFWTRDKSTEPPAAMAETLPAKSKNDIAPGGNKAMLLLADGSSVTLDSASNGIISTQGNIEVKKTAAGLLQYTINGRQLPPTAEVLYNTIVTPRGGQYRVTLSDGSQVWLNAASSLRFPVAFAGNERLVEVTGETYFEVARDEHKPFRVKTATTEVQVLGTHFNINAYDDEDFVKTTLLEGKVNVSAHHKPPLVLAPGQQSAISKQGHISVSSHADIEEVMAWKNGRFQYRSADLKTVLRQIARWYDVDIEYRGNVNLHFTGQLPRSVTASKVLEKLELTGDVRLRIEGRKIIVSP